MLKHDHYLFMVVYHVFPRGHVSHSISCVLLHVMYNISKKVIVENISIIQRVLLNLYIHPYQFIYYSSKSNPPIQLK